MKKKLDILYFNIIYIIFIELIFKIFTLKDLFSFNTLYVIAFSIPTAIILTLLETMFKNEKINRIITAVLTFLISFIFIAQFVYYKYYEAIFSIYSLFHGGQVLEFIDGIIEVMLRNIIPIILMFVPFIIPLVKKIPVNFDYKDNFNKGMLLLISIFIFIGAVVALELEPKRSYSAHRLYYETHVPTLTASKFGLITTMRLDAKRTIFGFEEQLVNNGIVLLHLCS